MNSLNVAAVDYVNKIVENVRCATCDKLEGSRVRYPCGHTGCDDCVLYTECCPTCSPPGTDAEARPDHTWTQTVKHTTTLLEACHKLFGPDVFQCKRISEQLKIEKELFPQCIQAPVKYENRRRSNKLDNKENRCSILLAGETVSPLKDNRMDNSVTYVRQWLNKNENNLGRKPFTDLNVNTQSVNFLTNKLIRQKNQANETSIQSSRKRTHYKTVVKDSSFACGSPKSVYESGVTVKKHKKELSFKNDVQNKCDNDESGIFMENELIVINDSQDTPLDKDKRAWLAVLEAHDKEQQSTSAAKVVSLDQSKKGFNSPKQTITSIFNITENNFRNVPFYKKSAILETCTYCKNEKNPVAHMPVSDSKLVVITVDCEVFITTVTVNKNIQSKTGNTNSVSVQTDTDVINLPKCDINKEENDTMVWNGVVKNHNNIESDTKSEDLFAEDRKLVGERDISRGVVIEESDSDMDLEMSGPVSVQADVHRSCEEVDYGVLRARGAVGCGGRRALRRRAAASSDSSDKENCPPNRPGGAPHHKKTHKKPLVF